MTVYGIDHVQVSMPAGGEALARRFYGELLGLTELPKPPNLALRGGAWFQCGALQLHLGVEAEFRPAKRAHPALLVSDLAQILATLSAAGFEIKHDSEGVPGVERAFTSDPFGNRIEFVEANPRATARA
jgi:catechol 2,3-dioxygenase-like lactoylglutathione lyase family enzyme